MKLVYKVVALGAAFSALSSVAEVGFYGVAAGGRAKTDIDYVRSVEGGFGSVVTAQTSFDDSDTAWKLSAGLRLNRGFALELTYADLGDIATSTRGVGGNFATPYGLDIRRKVHGLGLDLVGTLPVAPRLEILGKAGDFRTTIQDEIE